MTLTSRFPSCPLFPMWGLRSPTDFGPVDAMNITWNGGRETKPLASPWFQAKHWKSYIYFYGTFSLVSLVHHERFIAYSWLVASFLARIFSNDQTSRVWASLRRLGAARCTADSAAAAQQNRPGLGERCRGWRSARRKWLLKWENDIEHHP